MRTIPLLLLLPFSALASGPELPPELRDFLGAPPAGFEKKFEKPARQLRKAIDHLSKGKTDQALKELTALSEKTEMAEHASFELASLLRKKKQYVRSTSVAMRMLHEFPATGYREEIDSLILENDCDLGLSLAEKAKGPAARGEAALALQRCLQRIPWRDWPEREAQVLALYQALKADKNPLWGSFVAEIIQALPPSSPLRGRIQREVPDTELRQLANPARFRLKNIAPAGVKAVNPDQELFDKAMLAALDGKWKDSRELLQQMIAEYPQSEHSDRAMYWLARSEQALGNEEEAKRRFEQIQNDSPLSYYGLQSALRLKRDLSQWIVPASGPIEPMRGALLPRQALSLWRLRALLEAGLIDQARIEAEILFQARPGGFTFGQESAGGAALTALLYHSAGYSLAAFSHAAAAIGLEPAQLNTFTLDILFPSSFEKHFEEASEATGIHPFLLFSVAKQESAFLPTAVSRSNALGLMQLLLSTARDMDPKVSRSQLFDPSTNTRLGSRYLQKLLERFQGNIALALAGYNAGPTRAVQWQKRMAEFEAMKKSFDVDLFIDTIPFTETRKYVASILRNYAWYKLLNKDGKIESVEELAFQWQRSKIEDQQPALSPPAGTESSPALQEPPPEPEAPANP